MKNADTFKDVQIFESVFLYNKRDWDKTRHFPFFRVRNEKPEPRYGTIPVFLILLGAAVFTRMSKPLCLFMD